MSSPSPPSSPSFLPSSSVVRGGTRLRLVRAVWGVRGDLHQFFRDAARAGKAYEAFEAPLAHVSKEGWEQLERVRKEFGMEWASLIFTDPPSGERTVAAHFAEFKRQIALALEHGPCQINSHSGCDAWSYSDSLEFFTLACEHARTLAVPVYHETHRGRALYNPWVTRDLVKALPDLKLTADYSHWVNVCERLIDTEQDILTLIASRIYHVHSRVGFEQGPQVSDPRAPEWSRHVAAHERWWKEIFLAAEKRGAEVLTLTPEYGPGDEMCHYCPKLPYTGQPVADVDAICDWSAARMQRLFIEDQ